MRILMGSYVEKTDFNQLFLPNFKSNDKIWSCFMEASFYIWGNKRNAIPGV